MKVKVKSLRQACLERGIDPDNTGYQGIKQRWLSIERIIPGVADRKSPCEVLRERGHQRPQDARRMYTHVAAAKDAALIAEGGLMAYIALFCQLNNLTGGAS